MTHEKIDRLRAEMATAGFDALLVSSPVEDMNHNMSPNRRYLSGFTGSVGYVFVTQDRAQLAVDFRYWDQAAVESPHLELFKITGGMAEWLPRLFEGLGGKKVGIHPGDVTHATWMAFERGILELPEADRPTLAPAPPIVEKLRLHKSPDEIELLQRAITLGDDAFTAVSSEIRPGMTEKQVAWEIEKWVREHGGEGMSFSTIVAGGTWSAAPHANPRDEPLREGQPIVIDMGVIVDGYASDLTRTIILGEPDRKFREIYDIVFTAQQMAIESIQSGMTGHDGHMIAHNVIAEAGYGEAFGHGLGHGTGLMVHEGPRVSRGSDDVLEDGMVFSIEPGIYLPDWGGVRIEDLCVLENGRVRLLSHAPKIDKLGV